MTSKINDDVVSLLDPGIVNETAKRVRDVLARRIGRIVTGGAFRTPEKLYATGGYSEIFLQICLHQ